MQSDNSKKSIKSSGYGQSKKVGNRLYSPNGAIQQPAAYGSMSGVNRVRRDSAKKSQNRAMTQNSSMKK